MVRIITDSAADFSSEDAKRLGISAVLPLTVQIGDTTYHDGVDINPTEFYEKLIESDELPTTSQIPPYVFEEEFKKVSEAGDTAVVVLISSELSGTYQSACVAAAEYDCIHVVDSHNVSIGEQCLTEYAVRLRDEGKSAAEIAAELDTIKEDITVLALLDTLEYLKKGGRISATTAFVGGVLAIKPVITIKEGKVEMLGKARGSKNGNNLLRELVDKVGGADYSMPVYLGYSGIDRTLLNKYIEDSRVLWDEYASKLKVTNIGPTIGTHIGPGAIGVSFFKKV